ncbi:MAG: penicillin-binding transpeptidase domain-containing protein, partial [Candidatus Promineifilaceae bacterium]|nr:penicillin-binding transpeptidase domain-containing protein [Candidatus Promineifilaceae bacterium]
APEEEWPVRESGSLPYTQAHLEAVQEALWNVANVGYGTATRRFVGLPVPVAGKTGTAETPPALPHAWFVGYAPAAPYTLPDGSVAVEPQIAVVTMIEKAGEGSSYAAPLFRRIIELYFEVEPAPFWWIEE